MVISSDRYRPSATRIGSTSPIRSATEMSGVASFSEYRWSLFSHATSTSSPSFAVRSLQARQMGLKGLSLSSHPEMTGISSSSRDVSCLISLDLAWPLSPRRIMSCPARMAFSIWGTTESSKPSMPEKSGLSFLILAIRFRRISSFTVATRYPEARSSPTFLGFSLAIRPAPGRGCPPPAPSGPLRQVYSIARTGAGGVERSAICGTKYNGV